MYDIITSATFWTAVGSIAALIAAITPYFSFTARLKRILKSAAPLSEVDRLVSKMLRSKIHLHFKGYSRFILVRYGSSVAINAINPRDLDYMVLLLGYSEDQERVEYEQGGAIVIEKVNRFVDIGYRDYNSFIFSLVAGMPFEHGVMADAYFIDGDKGYFDWLQKIRENIQIDTAYMIATLTNRCVGYNKAIEDDLPSNCSYLTVIQLYSLLSTLIQIECLMQYPPVCGTNHIVPLTKAENLTALLPNDQLRNTFSLVVSLFKRQTLLSVDLADQVRHAKLLFTSHARSIIK
jgi:hypothetical protein